MENRYGNAYKKYSDTDKEYIRRCWGEESINKMSTKLKRSKYALTRYSERHRLGGYTMSGSNFSTSEVASMFGVDPSTILNYWIKKYGLKVSKEIKFKRNIVRIRINDLMWWCKHNQDKFSTLTLEEYALGKEPVWLKEKRKKDKYSIPKRQEWTTLAEQKLIEYVMSGMSNVIIAKNMNRTPNSISRKKSRLIECGRLDIKNKM